MHISLTPKDTLRFIEEANTAEIAHSLYEIPVKWSPDAARPTFKRFLLEADCEGPRLVVTLHADGTWTAKLEDVPSPSVGLQGYKHT